MQEPRQKSFCQMKYRSSYESINEHYRMDAGSCLMYRWQNIGVQIFLLLFIISVHHPNTSVSNDCDCVSADFSYLYTFTEAKLTENNKTEI